MSDTSQGPGWWLASDGKWYPPELWTGPPGTGPAAAQPSTPANQWPSTSYGAAQPSSVYPTATPGQAPYPGGAPAPYPGGAPVPVPSQPYGYGYGYGYGQPVPYVTPATRKTNGLAIASLVCSCAGIFLIGIPAVLGIIFGFVARSQIRRSNGGQGGDGLALAGIIVGFGVLAIVVAVLTIAAAHTNDQNNGVVSVVHATNLVHVLG
jgi:hypothetical protein